MKIEAPQLTIIILFALSLGLSWQAHGTSKVKTENGWTSLIAVIIQLAILYWGGFFS